MRLQCLQWICLLVSAVLSVPVEGLHGWIVHPQAARMAVSECMLGSDVSDFSSGKYILVINRLSVGQRLGTSYGPPSPTQLLKADRKLYFATFIFDGNLEKLSGQGVFCHGHDDA